MTNTVTHAAVTQSFDLPKDSLSTSTGIDSVCGTLSYSINEDYTFISLSESLSGVISLASNDFSKIGSYEVNLQASFTKYPSVPPAKV